MTNAELAMLSLVAERPRHGYEIEQVIEERGMREWTEVGFSSIYYLLKKLEREALVEGRLEQGQRGPARRVYALTPEGTRQLRKGVLEALSNPRPCNPSILLGRACLPVVSTAEAILALRRYASALRQHGDRLQQKQTNQQPLPYFVDAVFDHGLARLEAELVWVEAFIKRLEEHDGQA
jgi:DNA-binding PadR family transcriptional regulator